LPFKDIPAFAKVGGTLQFGDVVNTLCQNSQYLTSVNGTNACQASTKDELSSDWALIDPEAPHSYGAPVTSGKFVAIRDPATAKYLGYSQWEEGVGFAWQDEPTRATHFRILTSQDAQNDVESTARVPIAPKGGVIKPGELVLLLPQLEKQDKDVDKYSVYMGD
jgi:hypothetical protein